SDTIGESRPTGDSCRESQLEAVKDNPLRVRTTQRPASFTLSCGGDGRRASELSIGETSSVTAQPVAATGSPGPSEAMISAPITSPARQVYIARVDRICSRLDPARSREREDSGGGIDDLVRRYAAATTLSAEELHRIEAIVPPRGDGRALRANVFDVITRQLASRKQIHTALKARDLTTLEARQAEIDDLTRLLAGFARGYGFKVCGTY
ncbi:MAG: hypothetical protein ABI355_00345, partial [Solirubrobacteraceae bacterium]